MFVFLIIIVALAAVVDQEYILKIFDKIDIKNFGSSINWSDIVQNPLYVTIGVIASILSIIAYWKQYGLELPWSKSKTEKEVAPNVHHRRAMIDQVKSIWINGILDNSLYNVAAIDLGFDERRDRVDLRCNFMIRQPNYVPRDLSSNASIIDIFDKLGPSFLILGNPGSGKTTLLLQLTVTLLERANKDESLQIPVVFHLSTWAIKRLHFEDWLIEELSLRYGVSKELGKTWVKEHAILPLLDGLDEIAPEHRESCVESINQFREQHGLISLVICCRTEEYDSLNTRLCLPTAILVKPLTRCQIEEYLKNIGTSMNGVRVVLQNDEVLWELLEAPFMLNIVTLAFMDQPPEYIRGTGTPNERRKKIFDAYKDAMFDRRVRSTVKTYNFTQQQTEHWLSWLAKTMKQHNQSTFYLEQIQLDWLPSLRHQTILKIGSLLLLMTIFGLVYWQNYDLSIRMKHELIGGPVFGPILWIILGLAIGLATGHLNRWQAGAMQAEILHFNLHKGIGYLTEKPVELLPAVLLAVLFGGLVGGMTNVLDAVLICGLVNALAIVLYYGLERKDLDVRKYPNEGIHRSAKNSLFIGLVAGLAVGLAVGLVDSLLFGLKEGMVAGLTAGLVGGLNDGLSAGLVLGLFYGGYMCIMHYLLRVAFIKNNFSPLDYVVFLDYAADRILLRKIGGGYVFIHKMILDYFASLELNEATN